MLAAVALCGCGRGDPPPTQRPRRGRAGRARDDRADDRGGHHAAIRGRRRARAGRRARLSPAPPAARIAGRAIAARRWRSASSAAWWAGSPGPAP